MKTKHLRELCENVTQDIVDGPFGSEMKRSDYVSTGCPVLKIQDVKPMEIRQKSLDFVSAAKFEYLKRHSFRRGDIVITKLGDPLGVAAIIEKLDEGIIVADLVRIRAQKVNTKYLCYHLNSPQTAEFINSLQKGTTRPRVTLAVVRDLPIYVPPLPEQQRIVGILDEAFAGIATAKANTEKNLRNARELFESELTVLFAGLSKCREVSIGEICEFENGDRGKNYPNRSEYVPSGVPWINTGHIQPDGTLCAEEMNYISEAKFKSLRSGKIQPGDLVYCLRGATLGKTAMVEPFTVGAVASSLVIIRPSDAVDRHYLFYFLTSPVGQGLIKGYENGAAQPNLGAKSVAKFKMPLPSLTDQRTAARRVASLSTEIARLESLYEQKLAALDALKKSLLHQAFTGQLTGNGRTSGEALVAAGKLGGGNY